jgi:S-adenosylmethionine:tRNA ribosyltransferase-isomerase
LATGMLGTGKGTEYYLRIQDFDYNLPPESIAAHPATRRDQSRLMILGRESGETKHAWFFALSRILHPRSLLVVNDTRVIPARLRARKPTGGGVEVLLVRPRTRRHADREGWWEEWDAVGKGLGSLHTGERLTIAEGLDAEIVAHLPTGRGSVLLRFRGQGQGSVLDAAQQLGTIPLPPYVEAARRREPAAAPVDDADRYQTVYARAPGAVAAPTAGLHFTEALLDEIRAAGHTVVAVTLHVGPGTFRPVVADDPHAHVLAPEPYDIPADTAAAVNQARAEGRPVVAVGTTVVRTLEAAASVGAGAGTGDGEVAAGPGETDLYLLPGATFRVVTDLITNFHLPRSTLLMLVAAFAGRDNVLRAYSEAVAAGYRFYSYGDAMFVRRGPLPSTETSP